MAVLTVFFPGGVYPEGYNPSIPGFDFNPSLGELIDLNGYAVVSQTATQQVLQLANGLKLKLIGTGFTYDALGRATGGTLTTIQLVQNNGATLVQQLAGLSLSFEDAYDTALNFGGWDLNRWLMNGNDVLNGSAGGDDMFGHAGNDTLNGGDSDDYLVGGAGDDTYHGGNGSFDQISFSDAYDDPTALRGVTINAVTQTAIDPWGNSESFTSIESFRGTQFADSMTGSAGNEQFMGLGGRDNINGGAGIDEIRYHRDVNHGGNLGVNVNLTTGVAIDGFGRQDALSNIENVRGTEFNDIILGSTANNVLRGLGGNDLLNGLAGADTLVGGVGFDSYLVDSAGDIVDEASDGGSGTDTVQSSTSFNLGGAQVIGSVENLILLGTANYSGTGNALNNVIKGNSGINAINGGLGNDTLTGGAGNDAFFFNSAPNSATNRDTITDFSVLNDTIWLENAVMPALGSTGTLAAAKFWASTTGVAHDADDRIIYETDTGKLFYDADGSGVGVSIHFATLTAGLALTNADFLVL